MPDLDEVSYTAGNKAAWLQVLGMAMRGLGHEAPDYAALVAERAEVVASLRRLCAEHGDNDWPDNLNLSDVIEKHLVPYIG